MQEGAVVFSQKDVDGGLMEYMEAFANDMNLSVPDMLRQVFLRRLADHIAHNDTHGPQNTEFTEDQATAHLVDEWGATMMVHVLSERYKESKYNAKMPTVMQ